MKLVVVGGAGHVGSIVRPVLEQQHETRYFDRKPVPGAEDRTVVGDVNDDAAVDLAIEGAEAVVYLAMGVGANGVNDISPSLDVNTTAVYRWLHRGLKSGLRTFVYASSLSVYRLFEIHKFDGTLPLTDDDPADNWSPYGASKRLGEAVCQMAAQRHPQACIVGLRLTLPLDEKGFAERSRQSNALAMYCSTGPKDVQRLFLAAVNCARPGAHILNTSGDVEEKFVKHQRAYELLGWKPRGE